MDDRQASRIQRVALTDDFQAFADAVEALAEQSASRMLQGRCASHEEYLEARSAWNAYQQVLKLPGVASDILSAVDN